MVDGADDNRRVDHQLVNGAALPAANTAVFEVRRHGPTNADLTVDYTIGGTATEGVDYRPLRSAGTIPSVVIPAGRYAARIQIVPIDDSIPEGIETIVLSLTATTSPPQYLIWPVPTGSSNHFR